MIDLKCYINGTFVALYEAPTFNVINPATEEVITNLSLASEKEVDMAVKAAKSAFKTFQFTKKEDRINFLEKFISAYSKRIDDLAHAVTAEMGCPDWVSKDAQVIAPLEQAKVFLEAVNITSVAITKLDGSAKGAIVLAIAKELKLPIKLIGVGEKMEDLKDFNSEDFINALFVK